MASHSRGRALVTGLRGFTGGYIASLLRKAGYEVFGLVSASPRGPHEFQVDMRNTSAVSGAVAHILPEIIIHLAAVSFVAHGDVGEIYDTNVKGVLNLVEALRKQRVPLKKLLIASSGNIYGASATTEAIDESAIPQPLNHYGISKLAAEHVARLAMDTIPTIIVRPFNYTGIGQARSFIVPKLVNAFQNGEHEIVLGNIDTVRDFSDVRWVAMVYMKLIESEISGEVLNVCSGQGVCIRDVLHKLEEIAGYQMRVKTDDKFLRARELQHLVGSPKKLEKRIKVPPRPTFTETLAWMYAACSR